MSPRRNRRTRDTTREVGGGSQWTEEDWIVRAVVGAAKTYRCPGCNQEIHPGLGHIVAWQTGADEDRRHWHKPCWERRQNRGPR